ncbi:tyrosinase family oxidase copper chaperone [Amycolatopsis nigrescens]|uniref:tyrosinase family oxidase copper chaperone n=1 Tax=Amycolatopsis nigrescens TaxID=381445 RepID=UPI00037322CD|nr:tyrosinase family oxidase copper chaperone [Amycolatopsis nigrescens]
MTMNRREVLKVAVVGTATAGLTAAGGVALGRAVSAAGGGDGYTETYRGREIWVSGRDGDLAVSIDGRPLHLMKYGETAYLSALCHYEMAESPLLAARRAVDELRGANLLPTRGHHV